MCQLKDNDEETIPGALIFSFLNIHSLSVFEINGAHGARCAQSAVGRTIFGTVRPRFFSKLQYKYIHIEGCIGNLTGAQFGVLCAREAHK